MVAAQHFGSEFRFRQSVVGIADECVALSRGRHNWGIDAELDELLAGTAVISLEEAKGVGKNATAAERVDAEFRRVLLDR